MQSPNTKSKKKPAVTGASGTPGQSSGTMGTPAQSSGGMGSQGSMGSTPH